MASYPGYAGPMGLRSPIFGSPVTPPNLLGLTTDPDARRMRQIQGVGDTLTALGIGLMGQGTSTTPQSPLQGLAQGLAGAQQMAGQRTQEANQSERLDLARGQYGMEQQKFQDDQKRQALSDQYEQARKAEMEKLIVSLPPDQQSAARANPEAFWKAYAESKFPKEQGPQSAIAKLSADLKAGRISQAEYDAAVRKENYIAPRDPERTYRDITDPKTGQVIGQVDDRGKKDFFSNGITIGADGSVQIGGVGGKAATEPQMSAAQRAQLIQSGLDTLDSLDGNPNVNPYRVAGADTLAENGGAVGQVAANAMKTDEEQQYSAAQASALEGLASAVTGAGVAQDQFARYTKMLPQANDKPETKKVKRKASRDFLRVLLTNAGPAGKAVLDNLKLDETPAPPPPAPPPKTTAPAAHLKAEDGWQ